MLNVHPSECYVGCTSMFVLCWTHIQVSAMLDAHPSECYVGRTSRFVLCWTHIQVSAMLDAHPHYCYVGRTSRLVLCWTHIHVCAMLDAHPCLCYVGRTSRFLLNLLFFPSVWISLPDSCNFLNFRILKKNETDILNARGSRIYHIYLLSLTLKQTEKSSKNIIYLDVRCGEETRVVPRLLQMRSHWLKSQKESLRLEEAGKIKGAVMTMKL